MVAVDAPRPPAETWEHARVAGPGLELRAAPGPPGAFRALADPHRHYQQRDRRIGLMLGRDREDVEAETELEVVHLHGRSPSPPARGGGRQPAGGIQVVPDDGAVDADDAAQALPRRGHTAGYQHALVVGELQEVFPARAGRRARHGLRRLPGRAVKW